MHYSPFIIIFRRNKINCYLLLTDFLRFFMMSFKYGLILLRYSSTDSVLFLSPLLSYSMNFNIIVTLKIAYCYWFIIILFLFMIHIQKRFLIPLSILSLIALVFFFFSKRISYIFNCSVI